MLPELVALESVLTKQADWAQDASGVASLILRVLGNISTAYTACNDPTSAAIVLEAGIRKYEETAGVKSSAVRNATKQADKLLENMPAEERAVVGANRNKTDQVLNAVIAAFTEELGAYKQGSEKSKVEIWNEQGPKKMIGALRF